ncbi:MAG: DUF6077 domain-containing protein [Acidimicrobiales bacterium]|nr:DUF6077 domain-containing protein [Acidimicrobiales bacterium]
MGVRIRLGAHDRVARWSDLLVDGSVAALAAWTVVFHLARWTGMPRDGALTIWLVGGVFWLVARWLSPGTEAPDGGRSVDGGQARSRSGPGVLVAPGLLGVAAVLAFVDVDGLWWPGLWCGLAMLLVLAVRGVVARAPARRAAISDNGRNGRLTATSSMTPVGSTGVAATSVVVLALLMAVLSLVMVRPDRDDVFVVNRSTWVAEHDTAFPERDTIFSDDVLPVERPAGLPTSVEALVGSLAALLSAAVGTVGAASMTYLGFAPVVAALSVLATWRFLRGLGVRSPALATWVGTVFLVLDGIEHGSFGNFSAGRSWQGKVVFLVVVVPTLWHHATLWGSDGRRRHFVATLSGVLAGLGLTSTAVLVAPVVVVTAAAAGAVAATPGVSLLSGVRRTRVGWSVVAATPALLVGLATLAAEPQRLTDIAASAGGLARSGVRAAFNPLRWLDSGTEPVAMVRMVFGRGPTAFVALAAVLLAWTVVRDRRARLVLIAAPLVVFGLFGAPGVFDVLNEVGEADAIAWRMLWVLPVPAMVGVVLTARRSGFGAAPVVVPVVILAVVLATGTPITSGANRGTELVWPPALDLPRPEVEAARALLEVALEQETSSGGLVAGPTDVDFAVAVLSSEVKTTNPRASYLRGRHVDTSFGANHRRVLSHALTHGYAEWGADAVADALRSLRPNVVCLDSATSGTEVATVLAKAGYRSAGEAEVCHLWVLPG